MKYNFTIRIYQDKSRHPALTDLDNITISNITILYKQSKFGEICTHKNNQKKFKYTFELSKPFLKVAGSNSYPILAFRGEYLDIKVQNFPRYPAFYQDYHAARNCLNGYGYINELNKGFPHQLLYRNIDIILAN